MRSIKQMTGKRLEGIFSIHIVFVACVLLIFLRPVPAATAAALTAGMAALCYIFRRREFRRHFQAIDGLRFGRTASEVRRLREIVGRLNGEGVTRIDLRGCRLAATDFKTADLKQADLKRADLEGADFRRVRLSGARLDHASLKQARLAETRLVKASLKHAFLMGAVLKGADLSRADLRHACLDQADLTNADLSHARLDGTMMQAACLTGVRLSDTQLGVVKTLFRATLDPDLLERTREYFPHLLADPREHFWSHHRTRMTALLGPKTPRSLSAPGNR